MMQNDAQSAGKLSCLGILETSSPDPERLRLWSLFRQRLRELGYEEGTNIRFEARWADGKPDSLPALAAELVRMKVDAIVTTGTPAAYAAQRATNTIPIVMATGVSVGMELNQGKAGSGANITGLSDLAPGLSADRLSLLSELVPRCSKFAVLWDKTNPSGSLAVPEYQQAASTMGLSLAIHGVGGISDFDAALAEMKGTGGFIAVPSAMFFAHRERLAALALKYRLPAVFVRSEYARAGGLAAYGAPISGNYVLAALYVANILRGVRPDELSVEQPIEFELVINLKTASALGVEIPESVRRRARELIQ